MSHCLSRRMGCFEESLLFQKARHLRISRRQGAINPMVFDLHKTIPTHCDLLRASKWSFWCYLLLRVFLFSSFPSISLFWGFLKKRNFSFTAKSRGGYRDCPLHLHSLPHYLPLPLRWNICSDTPTPTHHNHPMSLVYLRVHSWCCSLYRFGQMYTDLIMLSVKSIFTALKKSSVETSLVPKSLRMHLAVEETKITHATKHLRLCMATTKPACSGAHVSSRDWWAATNNPTWCNQDYVRHN